MYFYTNPYNDAQYDENAKQNEVKINLSCDVFEYIDEESEDLVPLIGVHYYFGKDLEYIGSDDIEDEELKDQLFINRTMLNQQYFKLNFDKQLEFLKV